jgi:hypothetical protein
MKNLINGAYSKQDAATPRPVCHACAQGAMRQAATDPHREHQDKPILLGQQLTMDAFQALPSLLPETSTATSSRT